MEATNTKLPPGLKFLFPEDIVGLLRTRKRKIPVVVQDEKTNKVLLYGHITYEACDKTQRKGKLYLYNKQTKLIYRPGKEKNNHFRPVLVKRSTNGKSLLIKVKPQSRHHLTAYRERNNTNPGPVYRLIEDLNLYKQQPKGSSLTSKHYNRGVNHISKKLGEEAVELVIEAVKKDDQLFKEEAADLLFHFLMLLDARNMTLDDVVKVLLKRKLGQQLPLNGEDDD